MTTILLRCAVIVCTAISAVVFRPIAPSSFDDPSLIALNLLLGALLGGVGLLLEWQLRLTPLRVIVGGLLGLAAGAATAALLSRAVPAGMAIRGWPVAPDLLRPVVFSVLVLVGGLAGAYKGARFRADGILSLFKQHEESRLCRILDTSVIIDGRVADICETGFLDGTIVVPQFVLRELQLIADSSEALKRNRGRKGLDILQRIKKMSGVQVLISDIDFPKARDVDQKLIELALHMNAKIVTNDLNLNKVAQLRGVEVLNINELANSVKPVVLPGETMGVFIIKEGKEPNQGVAYLDDGTMVVVDNARRHLGKTVEVVVTSVLQTTAGKMFFGRLASDNDHAAPRRNARDREEHETVPDANKADGSVR